MAKTNSEKPKDFEEAFQKLEAIVQKLDQGDLSLDDLDKQFEEGMKLAEYCSQRLDQVEQKVNLLMEKAKGGVERVPFDMADEE